jgi:hypothetical protein
MDLGQLPDSVKHVFDRSQKIIPQPSPLLVVPPVGLVDLTVDVSVKH